MRAVPTIGADAGRINPAGTRSPAMPSFGILSFVNHLIVAILAGLGHVTTELVPPLDRKRTD